MGPGRLWPPHGALLTCHCLLGLCCCSVLGLSMPDEAGATSAQGCSCCLSCLGEESMRPANMKVPAGQLPPRAGCCTRQPGACSSPTFLDMLSNYMITLTLLLLDFEQQQMYEMKNGSFSGLNLLARLPWSMLLWAAMGKDTCFWWKYQ